MPTDMPKNDILVFEQFVRTKIPVLICLFGFSGCGKTLSAIKLAKGMGGKTMFLDTETGRGRVYAEDAQGFAYAELTPPFTPERYIAAIKQIEAAGYENLVIDSGSHEWDGLGGMLDIAESNVTKDGKKKTGLGKWSVKARHKKFMSTLLAGRMNIIICLRAKDKYIQEGFGNDSKVTMSGFVPLQERNFKYDMMIQLPMPEGGAGQYMMDRTQGFKAPAALLPAFKEGAPITEDLGAEIAKWIGGSSTSDDVLMLLKADATEAAELGVESFRAYWKGITQENRNKLKPFLPNLESIATEADAEAEVSEAYNEITTATAQPMAPAADISKLMPVAPAAAPEPIAAQTDSAADSDWQSVFDDLQASLSKCSTKQQFDMFFDDNMKSIDVMVSAAPSSIKAAWAKAVLQKRTHLVE